jgi:hypothetical protein
MRPVVDPSRRGQAAAPQDEVRGHAVIARNESDEAIHSFLSMAGWIASLALAMTAKQVRIE